jgi:hypothetical protein
MATVTYEGNDDAGHKLVVNPNTTTPDSAR